MAGSAWGRVALACIAMAVGAAPQAGVTAPSEREVCLDQFYTATHEGDVKSTTITVTAGKWVVAVAKDHGQRWANLPQPYPVLCVEQAPTAPHKWECVIHRKPCRMQTVLTPLTPQRPGLKLSD